MKADQQLWLLASDEGLPSLKPAADGVKPLNPVVEKLRVDPRVTTHLLPLPTHVAKESTVAEPKTKKTSKVTKPSAKDKAPPRFKARGPRMPEELRPFQLQTATKQRICYGYNLAQGCSLATSGSPKQCTKGVHVCAKCHKENHSLVNCRAN